mmetsp:Transcript_9483/g.19992  ORF Transcript_9483/g.19992 Transcript_9483/m.19992 type:complete len:96 (-) Transcript_9483:743-1030(-)
MIGKLPEHPLDYLTMPDTFKLPKKTTITGVQSKSFLQLLESFLDDFMHLVQSTDPKMLHHCSQALLHGIHSVFPPPAGTDHGRADPVSIKKMNQG